MNKPVGVPSGWEEIAAWHWIFREIRAITILDIEQNIKYCPVTACWADPHDWRVVE